MLSISSTTVSHDVGDAGEIRGHFTSPDRRGRPCRGRQGARRGAARHTVPIVRDPAIDRPRERHNRPQCQHTARGPPDPPRARTQQCRDRRRAGRCRASASRRHLDPLHGRVAGVGREAEHVEIGELPRPHPRGRRNVSFDKPRTRAAEGAIAVIDEVGTIGTIGHASILPRDKTRPTRRPDGNCPARTGCCVDERRRDSPGAPANEHHVREPSDGHETVDIQRFRRGDRD